MREIKFRAWIDKMISCDWDGENWSYKPYRAMKEVKSIHFGTGKIIVSDKHGNHSEHPDDYALMQYTGLKDKNGVEIYEGDIVIAFSQGSKATCEVKWGNGRVGFFLYNGNISKGWSLSGGGENYNKETCEVIGNIHENPELLEK